MIKLTQKRTKWFVFPQDDTGETKVEIIHLKPGEIADIEAEANQIVGRQQGDEFVTEVGFNLGVRTKLIVKKTILHWEGFENENGKKMKCTDMNKIKVLREFDWFFEQIEKFREELAEEDKKEQEEAGKN